MCAGLRSVEECPQLASLPIGPFSSIMDACKAGNVPAAVDLLHSWREEAAGAEAAAAEAAKQQQQQRPVLRIAAAPAPVSPSISFSGNLHPFLLARETSCPQVDRASDGLSAQHLLQCWLSFFRLLKPSPISLPEYFINVWCHLLLGNRAQKYRDVPGGATGEPGSAVLAAGC